MSNLKALVVILVLALAAFHLARPVALAYMTEAAFKRRRRDLVRADHRRVPEPVVLDLRGSSRSSCCSVKRGATTTRWRSTCSSPSPSPNVGFYVPAPLVNQFFELTQYRILSLAILLPAIFKPAASSEPGSRGFRAEDLMLAAFLLLQVALLMPFESFTNTLRRGFLFGLDTFVVFYAFSRIGDRARVAEVVASFWLACMVMALIAIFESMKGWLLYTGLAASWGEPNQFALAVPRRRTARPGGCRTFDQSRLPHGHRPSASYLYLRSRSVSRWADLAILGILGLATYVSYSRGRLAHRRAGRRHLRAAASSGPRVACSGRSRCVSWPSA